MHTLNGAKDSIVFHIDVNSAFLSWEAVNRTKGMEPDLKPSLLLLVEIWRNGMVSYWRNPFRQSNIMFGQVKVS